MKFFKTATSGSEDIDICNLTNGLMFCNCEPVSRNETAITCFIFNPLEPNDKVWSAFRHIKDVVVALTLASRYNVQLEFLPVTALQYLPYLQTIAVQEGKLGSLESGSVSNMSHLGRLLLERNEITSLRPYSIAHLPKLKKLILSENYLSEILAECLVDLMDLEELHLDRNNISRIESCAFCSMYNLKELVLWGNVLTDLTESMFRGLRYLTRIDLYRNQLRVISSKVFQGLPRLKDIDLKENILEYISDQAFYGLPNLMSLKLNDNRLKTLPDTVFKYPQQLMTVDVSSNLLETVQEDVVENMANLKSGFFSLRFDGNPLKCGCDLLWISRYVRITKSKSVFIRELHQMECQTSEGVWEIVHLFNFTDCDMTTESTTALTSGSTLTVEPSSSTTEVPKLAVSKEDDDDDNFGCRTKIYFGLYFLIALLSLMTYFEMDI